MKQTTERSETLKAHFKTHVSNAQLVSAQKFFRAFDAPLDQVLMRSLIKRLPEQAQEVVTRKTRVAGNLFEIER